MKIENAWVAEPHNPYEINLWYITNTENEINLLFNSNPYFKNYIKKRINREEYYIEKKLEYIHNEPILNFVELYKSSLLDKIPVILITVDQLTNLENLPVEIINELHNLNRIKKEMMYFNNHYTTGIPCSPARSEIYTGQTSVKSTMSDNNESSWQYDLVTPSEGLDTIGSLLKKSDKKYYNRYVGKWHMSAKEINPSLFSNPFPKVAQQNFLQKFGFDKFNDAGDHVYDKRGGVYTDSEVNEIKLPINYLDPDNLDPKNPSDGALPFLDKKMKELESNGNCWSLCINYTNPHDIAYIFSPNSDLGNAYSAENSPSGYTYPNTGLDINSEQYKESLDLMNFNLTSQNNFKELQTQNESSKIPENAVNNNPFFSIENTSGYSDCDISSMYAQSTSLYGIDSRNGLKYLDFLKQYRNLYFNLIKQIDSELGLLWDKIIEEKLNERAVIMITSDHGDNIGEHGLIGKSMSFYKNCWNVPLFFSYPLMDKNLKNTTSSNYTVHKQIIPTLLYFSNNKDLIPKYQNTPFNLILSDMAKPIIDTDLKPYNYNIVILGFSSLYTSFGPTASIETSQKLGLNPLFSNVYQISSVNKYLYNNKNDDYAFSIEFSLLTLLKSSFKKSYEINKKELSSYLYWYSIVNHSNSIIVSKVEINDSNKLTKIPNDIVDSISELTQYIITNSNTDKILLIQEKNKLIDLFNILFKFKNNISAGNILMQNEQQNDLSNLLNASFRREFIGLQNIQKVQGLPQKIPKIIGNFYNPILDYHSFTELYESNEFSFKLFNNTIDPKQNFNLLDPKRNNNFFDISGIIFSELKNNIIQQKLEDIYFTGPYYSLSELIYKNYQSDNSTNTSIGNFSLISGINSNFGINPEGSVESKNNVFVKKYKIIDNNNRNSEKLIIDSIINNIN